MVAFVMCSSNKVISAASVIFDIMIMFSHLMLSSFKPLLGINEYMIKIFNPLGLSHPYHLDESISIFRDTRSNFSFLFYFSMKIM